MMLEGDPEAGLSLYEHCLRSAAAPRLPVGLHLLFLDRGGKAGLADRLRRLALCEGGNIALNGAALAADPATAAAEYERLIAAGLVNVRMIEAYLMLLSRAGNARRIAEICASDRLLSAGPLKDVGGESLAEKVQAALLREEGRARGIESEQSVRSQRMIDNLASVGDPALDALLRAIQERVAASLAAWAAMDHPLSGLIPPRFALESWALISRGPGFTVPHVHHRGWLTGVYYPAAPEPAGGGGELRVGPPQAAGSSEGWPSASWVPYAGLLVLMPSYFTHWSVPLAGPGLRTAIAFDAVPAR